MISQKIRDWFNNATSKGRQNRKPVVKIVVSAMSEKRDRILSEEQLYSKMYYETRIKMHVDKKMEEGDGGESRLKVMNEIVKAMWKGEDKETKAEVRAERARLVAEKKQKEEELEEVLDKDEDAKLKPEEYATYVLSTCPSQEGEAPMMTITRTQISRGSSIHHRLIPRHRSQEIRPGVDGTCGRSPSCACERRGQGVYLQYWRGQHDLFWRVPRGEAGGLADVLKVLSSGVP